MHFSAAAVLLLGALSAEALHTQLPTARSSPLSSRRAALTAGSLAVAAELTAALLRPAVAGASTREGLLAKGSATRCEIGDGEACEKLAEGNPYILELQRKSKENRQKYVDEIYDKTVRQLGYSDYFDAIDQNLVQLPDGKYTLLSTEEYSKARAAGKIKIGGVDRLTEFPASYVEVVAPKP